MGALAVATVLEAGAPLAADPADDEDLDADDPVLQIVRRIVPAVGCPMPRTRAVCTVFAMATAPAPPRMAEGLTKPAADSAPRFGHLAREPGITRVEGMQYPRDRWTEEKAEHERQRRARQKPPRPTRRAKTRGRKLLELIGEAEGGSDC